MELLIAFDGDDAASRMASRMAVNMERDHTATTTAKDDMNGKISGFWRSKHYDMITISTPAISADWLEDTEIVKAGGYDGFVFLSKHAAESGILALTCHSTGNFTRADFGGNDREVAIPHPHFQKAYLKNIYEKREQFSEFDITIEATHHGPSALDKPTIFVEIGTTPKQWCDDTLCSSISDIVQDTLISDIPQSNPVAICFGSTHYPSKFTKELLHGKHALGTVIPKRAIPQIDDELFAHIMQRNDMATVALLEWGGIQSADKKNLCDMLSTTNLNVIHI